MQKTRSRSDGSTRLYRQARVQCAAPPARVAVRVLIRLMMAHLDPKALRHVVEPEIELRLDALAERIALGELRHLRHTVLMFTKKWSE